MVKRVSHGKCAGQSPSLSFSALLHVLQAAPDASCHTGSFANWLLFGFGQWEVEGEVERWVRERVEGAPFTLSCFGASFLHTHRFLPDGPSFCSSSSLQRAPVTFLLLVLPGQCCLFFPLLGLIISIFHFALYLPFCSVEGYPIRAPFSQASK